MAPYPVLRGSLAPCSSATGLGSATEKSGSALSTPCRPQPHAQLRLQSHAQAQILPRRRRVSLQREHLPERCTDTGRKCAVRAPRSAAEAAATETPSQTLPPGRMVFIVNPKGGGGGALRQWRTMREELEKSVGGTFQVEEALTEYRFHAAELAEQAARSGATAVVAVGGDGTVHEVANGLFKALHSPGAQTEAQGKRTALGVLPLGTGCDFARSFGWKPNDLKSSAQRFSRGQLRPISVGRVQLPLVGIDRVFVNIASVHFSASVCQASESFKALGPLCYALAVVTEFPSHRNRDLAIRVNAGEWEVSPEVTAMAIGNGQFFGGGMHIAPLADPSSSDFHLVVLKGFELKDYALHGLKLFAGTHLPLDGVTSQRIESIEIKDPIAMPGGDGVPATLSDVKIEVDGEPLGTLPVAFSIVPAAMEVIV